MAFIMILQMSMPVNFAAAETIAEQELGFEAAGHNAEATTNAAIKLKAAGKEGKDIGNIFSNVSLTVDDNLIGDGDTIEIDDDTEVKLKYGWEIGSGVDVKAGDWSQIIIPDAFITEGFIFNGDIILSNGDNVGKYTLIGNTLKFVFNEAIEDSVVRDGFAEFRFEFNLTKFNENVIQEIPFSTTLNNNFTIVRKPEIVAASISKKGELDKNLNPSEIEWSIDIINTEEDDIVNAAVADTIPAGLKLDPSSIEIYGITVGYSGNTIGNTKISEGSLLMKQLIILLR